MRAVEWVSHHFEYFGLSCDIFLGAPTTIMLEPSTPNIGLLSQRAGALALSVEYGPDCQMSDWLKRVLAWTSTGVSMQEERAPADFCGRPAERVVLKVVPTPVAVGHRLDAEGVQPINAEPTEPYLLTAVGAVHRQTPLTVMFQRPLIESASDAGAEDHFFASFRCQS